jgi:hypothetical protein
MRVLSVFLVLFLGLTLMKAENDRDFAGQYALSNVPESIGLVNATLTARLHNYSGHDLRGARLPHAGPPETVLADNVAYANHAYKAIRARATLTRKSLLRIPLRGD